MTPRVKLTGARDLERALGELSQATGKRTSGKALEAGGAVIRDAAKGFAPRDRGDLIEAIQVGSKLSRRQRRRKIDPVERFVGVVHSIAGHGVVQEYGTWFHAPQPFMRPAFPAKGRAALGAIMSHLKTGLDKAVKRARAKAAKAKR